MKFICVGEITTRAKTEQKFYVEHKRRKYGGNNKAVDGSQEQHLGTMAPVQIHVRARQGRRH